MPEITKLKIDPVAAVAFLFGAAVIIPSLTVLTITLFAVARMLLN
ncbi:hypothetical protein [Parvibaculum sp.]|jgi:hypothetical protein|nr:hypothetical protein [Parvibaculum sp.]|tara:strand:+ start:26620 stop:26754 length:135 start_codon:yes stop_codon:yes gene_type:complete